MKEPVTSSFRRNFNGTPNHIQEREHESSTNNIFNNSMRSVGVSEISQAFNAHFNAGNELNNTNLTLSQKSTSFANIPQNQSSSINDHGVPFPDDTDYLQDKKMMGSMSGISKPSEQTSTYRD